MSRLLPSLLLAAAFSVAPALAQSDAETDAAIDAALGDHTAYRAAFDAIQQDVAEGDKAGFAEWVSYPIEVKIGGDKVSIADAGEFVARYDEIVTDEIRNAISGQAWADLFVNYQGIMFGNGQVWLNGICKDDACTAFDVRIITIQPTAN